MFDLFADLKATDEQMDFQIVYASGMNGIAGLEPGTLNNLSLLQRNRIYYHTAVNFYNTDKLSENLQPLFKEILKLPLAQGLNVDLIEFVRNVMLNL